MNGPKMSIQKVVQRCQKLVRLSSDPSAQEVFQQCQELVRLSSDPVDRAVFQHYQELVRLSSEPVDWREQARRLQEVYRQSSKPVDREAVRRLQEVIRRSQEVFQQVYSSQEKERKEKRFVGYILPKSPAKRNKLILPPGARLRAILHTIYPRKTAERVFDQTIADMQLEWQEAIIHGKKGLARWVQVRGVLTVFLTASVHVVATLSSFFKLVKSRS